jgi:hypothetical protein
MFQFRLDSIAISVYVERHGKYDNHGYQHGAHNAQDGQDSRYGYSYLPSRLSSRVFSAASGTEDLLCATSVFLCGYSAAVL